MKNALVVCLVAALVLSLGGVVVAADDAAKEIKGDAGCAKCCFKSGDDCAAAVKVGYAVYTLKAGEKASDDAKKMIDSFKSAKEATPVVITGTIKDKTIIVDDIKKAAKKAPAKE